MVIDLTDKEWDFIRQALRNAEENHTRNGFKALAEYSAILRSKIADAIIDNRAIIV